MENIIYSYTADQAVEDGILVDAGKLFGTRVLITNNLWVNHVGNEDENIQRQNLTRLISAAATAFAMGDPNDTMRTSIWYDDLRFWGVIDGAGLTLMLPEDY